MTFLKCPLVPYTLSAKNYLPTGVLSKTAPGSTRRFFTPEVREAAWNQILYYFKKLQKRVAEKVTETEVKLTLPEQKTPAGRKFTIEGIVDIVTENDETAQTDYILANLDMGIVNAEIDRPE
jgi:hypothetical protein